MQRSPGNERPRDFRVQIHTCTHRHTHKKNHDRCLFALVLVYFAHRKGSVYSFMSSSRLYGAGGWFLSSFWHRIWAEQDRKGVSGPREGEGGGVRSPTLQCTLLLATILSHTILFTRVHYCVLVRLVTGNTSRGLSQTIALILHYPPLPCAQSFAIGPAVINNNMHVCHNMHVCLFYMFIILACCMFLLVSQHTAPFPDLKSTCLTCILLYVACTFFCDACSKIQHMSTYKRMHGNMHSKFQHACQ